MFGKNPVAPIVHDDGLNLLVREVFPTLQGEGPDAGTPATFVRLGGCNLRCYFCDTDFDIEASVLKSIPGLLATINDANWSDRMDLVVLTGGEPLRQNVVPLVQALNAEGYRVQVETAGTVCPADMWQVFHLGNAWHNSIVCSPKTPHLSEAIVPLVTALKYIVRYGELDEADGLPKNSTQRKGYFHRLARPWGHVPVFLQPMDEGDPSLNALNSSATIESAQKFGHRVSVQVHKMLNLP